MPGLGRDAVEQLLAKQPGLIALTQLLMHPHLTHQGFEIIGRIGLPLPQVLE